MWAAMVACALAVAVVAGRAAPASARMVKLAHGYANFAPASGAKMSTGRGNFDAVFTNLDYSGGPVMPSNDNYVVVWRPSNYSGPDFQSGTGSQLDYVAGVTTFFSRS